MTTKAALNPTAVGVGYQGLPEPAAPAAAYVPVDISTTPWDGSPVELAQPGRQTHYVPPALASHVIRHKKIAAAQAEGEHDLRSYLPSLRKETAGPRGELAKL